MSNVTLFHNPRCSKSRAVHALLSERGIDMEVIEYLKSPLSAAELVELQRKLGRPMSDLVRTGDEAFSSLPNADVIRVDDDALVTALVDNPALMQRPIVVTGNRAAIGRPPEAILDLLEESAE